MSQLISETTEVREPHHFDVAALENYMGKHVKGFKGKLKVRQFTYGRSNPTFLLENGNRCYVMRKKPPGKLLPSAHAVDREYRIITALADTDVPVPETYALCEDPTLIGTAFYIMEFVDGRLFRDPIAAEARSAEERAAIFDSLNDTLAKLHLVDWESRGLADFGKPGNYMARQVSRWTRQYEAAKTEQIESMNLVIRWLQEHIPEDHQNAIVHGDFRLGNCIVHPTEPRITAVLDWELATLGEPLTDLAYHCMGYHMSDFEGRGYPDEKRLRELGIPTEKEYVAAYCRRTGCSHIPDWGFFLAFSMFRVAAITQGVYKRGLDGIAASEDAKNFGVAVRLLAGLAWKLAQRAENGEF